MLLPNQWVRSRQEQALPIFSLQGPEFNKVSDKVRLQIKSFHANLRYVYSG